MSRLAIMAVALILMTGCDGQYATYTPSAADLTRIAQELPEGPTKEMIAGTAVSRYLTAEAAQVDQEQALAQAQIAQATAGAAERAAAHQVMMLTAEAQATVDTLNAQGTAQALSAQATRQTVALMATQTAEAIAQQATTQAQMIEATATERAYRATATQQTINQQATMTQQAYDRQATHTAATATRRVQATTESHQATAQVAHATMTRQAEKREAVLGYGRDYGIPLLLLAIAAGIGGLVVYGIREMKKRPVVCEPSLFGDAQQVRIPNDDDGFTFVDLDLLPGAVTTVRRNGSVIAPILRDPAREEADKRGDQAVNALSRPRIGAGHQGQSPLSLPPPPARNRQLVPGLIGVVAIDSLDNATTQGMLPKRLAEAIEAEWTETQEEARA